MNTAKPTEHEKKYHAHTDYVCTCSNTVTGEGIAPREWHKIEVRDNHTCWESIGEDGAIFCVYPNGETPSPTSGGYFKYETAWKVKGLIP